MVTYADARLTIELEKERPSYYPGDPLRGTIQLHLPKDSAVGRVSVCVAGCTKSRINQSNGQSTSTFRGSAELFHLEQTLHDGHYTHKSGVLNWRFEFQVPDISDSSNVGVKWNAREGFLATTDNSELHPLPPPFKFTHSKTGKTWYAFITYAIEAKVTEPADHRAMKSKVLRVSRAIRILPRPTPDAVDVNDPQQRRGTLTTFTIRTLRLLPEHASQLAVTQRMKSMFSPSKLPRFTFDIDVSYPSIIQMYHLQPLPFVISASPRTEAASTTIQPNMRSFYRYPSLKIKHAKVTLQASTDCRCSSILSDTYAGATHDIHLLDRHFNDMSLAMRSLAWDQKNRVEEEIPSSINFGKECNIFITNDSRDGGEKSTKAKGLKNETAVQTFITPSFSTYNISRRYHLSWSIDLECAGEKIAFKGRSSEEITVLGPAASESGELLPDDAFWIVVPGGNGDSDNEEFQSRPSNRDTLPAYSELLSTESRTADPSSARRLEKQPR